MSQMRPMARFMAKLREYEEHIEALEAAGREIRRQFTGSLQVQKALLEKLGGEVTIPAEELAKVNGRVQVIFDKQTNEFTFVAIQPEESENTDIDGKQDVSAVRGDEADNAILAARSEEVTGSEEKGLPGMRGKADEEVAEGEPNTV